jgi:haloalkane dehalogenase
MDVRLLADTGQEVRMEMKNDQSATPADSVTLESRFVKINGYRIHYVEAGQGDPVLFIHGNPTSSYIWRNILPRVARESGKRGIAIDLLGFGKSDKLEDGDYSAQLHAEVLEGFIEALGLRNIILVLHDWGGPIGASYAVRHPGNIRGVALLETFLWDLSWEDFGKAKALFWLFRSPVGYPLLQVMNLFVNRVLPGAVLKKESLTTDVMKQYREPFPTVNSRRAVRQFPCLLPIEGKPKESWLFIKRMEEKLPLLKSPVMWIKASPGAIISKDTEYHLIELSARLPQLVVMDFGPGLHYLQEENPDKVADLILSWMRQYKMYGTTEAASRTYRRVA